MAPNSLKTVGFICRSLPLRTRLCIGFKFYSPRKWLLACIWGLTLGSIIRPQGGFGSETIPCVIKNADYRTNLGVNNLESSEANVSLLLYDNAGKRLAERTIKVPARGYFNATDLVSYALGSPFASALEGYLRLDSTSRITAFASQIDNRNNEPLFLQSVNAGSSHLYFPQITSQGSWKTFLAIVNLSSTAGQIQLTCRDSAGQVFLTAQKSLAARAQWVVSDFYREMAIPDQEGTLEIETSSGILLAAIARLISSGEQVQTSLVPVFDLNGAAEMLNLPYVIAKASESLQILLHNPGQQQIDARLLTYDSNGRLLRSTEGSIPSKGTLSFGQEKIFPSGTNTAPYGLIQATSEHPIIGVAVTTAESSGNRNYTPFVPEGSPELLIPAAIQSPPFFSRLLVVNLTQSPAWVRMQIRNSEGVTAGRPFDSSIPGLGALKLDQVLPVLSITDRFFGPLSVTSLQGQPLVALSQISTSPGAPGGGLAILDKRPVTRKKIGDLVTLRWDYDPGKQSAISEFRIYRSKRGNRVFARITALPATELEYRTEVPEPGEYCYVVKAFDGKRESVPSNEIIVAVESESQ
jgi:hypothetical protein